MKSMYTEAEVAGLLKRLIATEGCTQRDFARRLEISEPYLCDILQGKRAPGTKVCELFGLEKQTRYMRTA